MTPLTVSDVASIPSQRRAPSNRIPSRSEARQVLVELAAGTLSAEEAAAWATAPMVANHTKFPDDTLWRTLARIVGAHRVGRTAVTLEEFRVWLAEFDAACA